MVKVRVKPLTVKTIKRGIVPRTTKSGLAIKGDGCFTKDSEGEARENLRRRSNRVRERGNSTRSEKTTEEGA